MLLRPTIQGKETISGEKGSRRPISFLKIEAALVERNPQRRYRMRLSRVVLSLAAMLFFKGATHAQDWADDLIDTPKLLAQAVPGNPKHLTMTEAKALVENTLQLQDAPAKHYVDDPNFYCIIHLVKWKEDTAQMDSTAWFVFRGGKTWNAVKLEGTRLYGSRHVAVLYVHWVQAVMDPAGVAFTATATKDDYDRGRFSNFEDQYHRNTLMRIGGVVYVTGYPPTIPVDYRIEVTRKTIAPFGHLLALASAASQAGGGTRLTLQNRTVAIWAGKVFDTQYATSDVLVKAQTGADSKELDKKTFDDEGNYHFDFSAGIPIRGIKQLQYDTTNNTATPKTTTAANAYGLINYFINPIDVKTDYSVWPPSFVGGFGLTGRPFDKPMLGLGFGYGKVSGFVGCVFNKVTAPGATPLSTTSHREEKFVFGINVTARQLADLLKKK